ncbi:hypothetical protein Tco_0882717 [Tanacetum coccineum]
MKGGRCFGGHGYKEVTKELLEALEIKGGNGDACKLLGRLLGDVIKVLEMENYIDENCGLLYPCSTPCDNLNTSSEVTMP